MRLLPEQFLRARAYRGLKRKYSGPVSELHERLDYELTVISSVNASEYCLFLSDLSRFAAGAAVSDDCWKAG
jgi:DNA polymerase III alpha subunit